MDRTLISINGRNLSGTAGKPFAMEHVESRGDDDGGTDDGPEIRQVAEDQEPVERFPR